MTFKTQLTTDLSVFFNTDEFADSVTYTPVTGAASTIKAIITYGEGESYRGSDNLNIEAVMEIKASDVTLPVPGDAITIGTETWKVLDAEKIDDGLIWRCIIGRMNR